MSSVVASSVLGVKARLANLWPVPVDDKLALSIGVCAHLSNSNETLELICNRRLYQAVVVDTKAVSVNNSEFIAILKQFCARGCSLVNTLESGWFAHRVERVERALLCTLSEPAAAALWQRPAVRIASVLVFSSDTQIVSSLDEIFGTVVRSDARRCDDLHFSFGTERTDPFELSELLDVVAGSVV